jgi:hypothetical protein
VACERAGLALRTAWPDDDRLTADVAALHEALDAAEQSSALPDQQSVEPALHDLLVRARLAGLVTRAR